MRRIGDLTVNEFKMMFIGLLIGLWIASVIAIVIEKSVYNFPFIVFFGLFILQKITIYQLNKDLQHAKKKEDNN